MTTLTERFAVDPADRDRAKELLNANGHDVLDAEDGGGDFDRDDRLRAVIVVRSVDDVQDPTPEARKAFATTIGDLLDSGDISWRLV